MANIEVFLVVAESQIGAMNKARAKWKGVRNVSVDHVMQIDCIDGCNVLLQKDAKDDSGDVLKECGNDYSK